MIIKNDFYNKNKFFKKFFFMKNIFLRFFADACMFFILRQNTQRVAVFYYVKISLFKNIYIFLYNIFFTR